MSRPDPLRIRFKILNLFMLLFISSCALRPIPSEYFFVKTDMEIIELERLGNGKILIYNGADVLHRLDNTARLNIWINEKALGQIRGGEYVIVDLKNGKYDFNVLHIDLLKMRSGHGVVIDDTTKVIRIEPTITSNKLTITNELPKRFEKFRYAEKR